MDVSKADGRSARSDALESTTGPSLMSAAGPTLRRDASPELKRPATTSHAPTISRGHSGSLSTPSLPPSSTTSPQTSRTTSPTRPTARATEVTLHGRNGPVSSRKGSHDASPIRPPSMQALSSGMPSATAIQRALSTADILQRNTGVESSVDQPSKLPRTPRSQAGESSTSSEPTLSPRGKSYGPSVPSSRRNSIPRKAERAPAPPITVQSSTPPKTSTELRPENGQDPLPVQTPKASTRGSNGPKTSLETVQEATPPTGNMLANMSRQEFQVMNTSQTIKSLPANGDDRVPQRKEAERAPKIVAGDAEGSRVESKPKTAAGSGADQGRSKSVSAKSLPPVVRSVKQVEGARNMTVETETVASIPQSALVADRSASNRTDAGGSIRLKPSNETIRPRKERKRAPRKAPSIHNGTASSKADIFEARVASQVDEAESSDSDETFVYESNPVEPQMRSHRNHSRTPSVTSVQSQSDRRVYRAYDNHRVAGKRSMKFSNNPYNILDSPTDADTGTIRAHHPRNISRFGRTVGSNSSLYDQDSPFTQASKLRQNLATSVRQSPRPTTPQSHKTTPSQAQSRSGGPWGHKGDSSLYDLDDDGADDERAPLMGTVRTPRNRHMRRVQRPYEHMYSARETSWLVRYGGCLFATIVVLLLLLGGTGFLVMSNRAMYEVGIAEIRNVLASEQEIMLDITVAAINPNVLGISITDVDLNLFARSKHLATTTTTTTVTTTATPAPSNPPTNSSTDTPAGWRIVSRIARRARPVAVTGTPWQDPSGHWHDSDEPSDSPSDKDSETMLLGRVLHFDSGLFFEGSPIKRHQHYSSGEFRLTRPGNSSEAGGGARWEQVLQHQFELIVRGVLRYQSPVSNKEQTAAVSGSVVVDPTGTERHERMTVSGLRLTRTI